MARSRLPPRAIVAIILSVGIATFLVGALLPVYYWPMAGVKGDDIDARDYTEGDTLLIYGKVKYIIYTHWSHSTKITLQEGNFTFVVSGNATRGENLTGRMIHTRIVLGQSRGSGWYADGVSLVDETNDSFRTIAITGAGIAILGAVLGALRVWEARRIGKRRERLLARGGPDDDDEAVEDEADDKDDAGKEEGGGERDGKDDSGGEIDGKDVDVDEDGGREIDGKDDGDGEMDGNDDGVDDGGSETVNEEADAGIKYWQRAGRRRK